MPFVLSLGAIGISRNYKQYNTYRCTYTPKEATLSAGTWHIFKTKYSIALHLNLLVHPMYKQCRLLIKGGVYYIPNSKVLLTKFKNILLFLAISVLLLERIAYMCGCFTFLCFCLVYQILIMH